MSSKLPDGWKEVVLGDISELITSGATPTVGRAELYSNEREGIPFFRIQNVVVNTLVLSDLKYVTREVHNDRLKRSQAMPGDVLMTITGRLGTAAVVPPEVKEANINQHVCLIRLKDELADPQYIAYHLNSDETHREIMRKQHGSTRIALNHKTVGSLTVNLPPIGLQRKIASILGRTQRLMESRELANRLTSKIIQSVFLKLFGDPVHNPKGWEVRTLKDACSKITDGTHNSPPNSADWAAIGVPYVTAKNVKPWGIDLTDLTYVKREDHEEIYRRCNPEKYDLLYVKDGVKTGIAAVNLLDFQFSILSSLALFKPIKAILNPFYLQYVLNSHTMFTHMTSEMKGAAIRRLTLNQLNAVELPLPPIDKQNKFGEMAGRDITIRRRQKESFVTIKELFYSLMHKAFRGELRNAS